MTGYHDITPRFGAAYDLFGNGKTALKVNLGKYLQGASVSNLAGPAPTRRCGFVGGGGGIFPPVGQPHVGGRRWRLRPRLRVDQPDGAGNVTRVDWQTSPTVSTSATRPTCGSGARS